MRPLALCISLSALGCGTEVIVGGDRPGPRGDPPDVEEPRPDDEHPPVAACGVDPKTAVIGEDVVLVGENSHDPDDYPILSWFWKLVDAPEGSVARLPRGAANIEGFSPDVLGDYTFTLVVTDEAGKSSTPCATTLSVISEDGLYIELIKVGHADETVLLVKPKDEDPCAPGPGLCNVAWGNKGAKDDPVATVAHDRLDTIAVEAPAANAYDVGVYVPYLLGGAPREVTAVIWVDGHERARLAASVDPDANPDPKGTVVPLARVLLPAGTVQDLRK